MGIIEDLFGAKNAPKGIKKVEQFCHQINWQFDRIGSGIVVGFTTPAGRRQALITVGDAGEIGTILVSSAIEFYPGGIPDDFPTLLLVRNQKLSIGGWVTTDEGRKVGFAVRYTLFVSALTAGLFKSMCEMMVKEVAEIDKGMADKGF